MAAQSEKRVALTVEDSPGRQAVLDGTKRLSDGVTSEDGESTFVGEGEVVAEMTDLDDQGFKVVSHRKKRTVGIPVIISAVDGDQDLRKANPIAFYSALETLLGKAPLRSRFTSQGALLLDVGSEEEVNTLLKCSRIGNIAVVAHLPHSYLQNTCIIKGVPTWHTEEELLAYLKPQGVLHVRRVLRRIDRESKEWKTKPTDRVVLSFAPNCERPDKINLGFTRHEVVEYTESPSRCFKCQRFGHVARVCKGEQRCKRCAGPHDFKECKGDIVCANCRGDHPASFSRCPFRISALHRRMQFITGPKTPPSTEVRPPCSKDFPPLNDQEPVNQADDAQTPKNPRVPDQRGVSKGNCSSAEQLPTTPVPRQREPYASAVKAHSTRTKETNDAREDKVDDCKEILRVLFAALRSHVATMPPSVSRTVLEALLALEFLVLSNSEHPLRHPNAF